MSDDCKHETKHKERLRIIKPDTPYRCDMCVNEALIGIEYKTKLGRIALCEDCLRVIEIVAKDHAVEDGETA